MRRTLYLGLECPSPEYTHYPVIRIAPYSKELPDIAQALSQLPSFTHFLFTSKSAVKTLQTLMGDDADHALGKPAFAVGKATAAVCQEGGYDVVGTASTETAEGLTEMLDGFPLENARLFWPHSVLSRDVIPAYARTRDVVLVDCAIYTTIPQCIEPVPNLDAFDEIIFTSPSTVEGFLDIFGQLPCDKQLTAIGSITQARLDQ